uniref:Uncharacterized protein n=1 Tax=viral metagenome TaxID=1070528 RepID=A0A6C0BRY7_9ZZZZ
MMVVFASEKYINFFKSNRNQYKDEYPKSFVSKLYHNIDSKQKRTLNFYKIQNNTFIKRQKSIDVVYIPRKMNTQSLSTILKKNKEIGIDLNHVTFYNLFDFICDDYFLY